MAGRRWRHRPTHGDTVPALTSPVGAVLGGESAGAWFASLRRMDALRRSLGDALGAAGYAPERTPSTAVQHGGVSSRLRRYGEVGHGPPILLVPAPIKRAYIWDISHATSVVRRLTGAGFLPYVLEWLDPTGARSPGLADYVLGDVGRAVAMARRETGTPPILAGHSLGGTLCAIYASVQADVAALLLADVPLCFGPRGGAFWPWVRSVPPTLLADLARVGPVPGSFLDLASIVAAPEAFVWQPAIDAALSLRSVESWRLHRLVERWALDEMAMPGRFFLDVVETLYRRDLFARGRLVVAGRQARLAAIGVPILAILERRSRVVPPQAVLPGLAATGGPVVTLWYDGEVGVHIQHVGILVGPEAHRRLWPEAIDWARSVWAARDGSRAGLNVGGNPKAH